MRWGEGRGTWKSRGGGDQSQQRIGRKYDGEDGLVPVVGETTLAAAATALGRRRLSQRQRVTLVIVIGARVGGLGSGTWSCGGGGGVEGVGRSPSLIFLELPLEREFTLFFLQMTARVCGGGGSVEGVGRSPSLIFLELPLEREFTLFFLLQMTARVCGGVASPLIGPILGREEKGPT